MVVSVVDGAGKDSVHRFEYSDSRDICRIFGPIRLGRIASVRSGLCVCGFGTGCCRVVPVPVVQLGPLTGIASRVPLVDGDVGGRAIASFQCRQGWPNVYFHSCFYELPTSILDISCFGFQVPLFRSDECSPVVDESAVINDDIHKLTHEVGQADDVLYAGDHYGFQGCLRAVVHTFST